MRTLPPLVAGSLTWTLPFSDRSAACLVEQLLATSAVAPVRCADNLTLDPPLMLWAASRAWYLDGLQPRSLKRLAQWLHSRADRVLIWPEMAERDFGTAVPDHQRRKWVAQVEHDLTVAELAAAQAAADGEELAEQARLLGLLSGARHWLDAIGGAVPDDILPPWLLDSEPTPAGRHVSLAVGMARSETGSPPLPIDIQARREWASQNARAWEVEIPAVASLLPPLVARLGRLALLERQFSETLETEKLQSLAELAAGAGHEINNPLAIIAGRAQLLLRDEQSPDRQRELALIIAQVRRANEMIADMRLFSRPPEPEPQRFDLARLIDQTVAELAEQAAHRAVEIVDSGEKTPVEIEADPVQIGIVLHALIRNALEAIGRDGVIEISMRRTPTGAEVSVADNGPGILPEERRHIFDPFYSARQAGRGLGFGLSKAWRIVTNHGGNITVDSEPGEGAVFVIHLPRRIPERRS